MRRESIIVLEPGQKVDPYGDRIFLFSIGEYAPLGFTTLVNGQPGPPDPLLLQVKRAPDFA